jgi:hypothetical protein
VRGILVIVPHSEPQLLVLLKEVVDKNALGKFGVEIVPRIPREAVSEKRERALASHG